MDALLTTEEVADFFRVDVVTIRRMIGKGELSTYRVGGEYRFKRTDIDEYLERHRLPAHKEAHQHVGNLTQRARKLLAKGSMPGAFDRFTERARNVMALAQDEARRLNHDFLGTEHLLLGILREKHGVGAKLLEEVGQDLGSMRRSVQEHVGPGPQNENTPGELCLTPRLKKVLELSTTEAKGLDHAYVGTEHLVLGLLAEGEGVAGRLLRDVGMDLRSARARVQTILSERAEG